MRLNAESWKLVRAWFDRASELPAAERAPLLTSIADADVRTQVQSMLDAADEEESVLDAGLLADMPNVIAHAAVATPSQPLPGDRFEHYEIVRHLGSGGAGTVYEARDVRDGARVALKVLHHEAWPEFAAADTEQRKRFLREARILATLRHPNVVTIHDVVEVDARIMIAMEFVEGTSLEERLREHGAFTPRETVAMALQIAAALEAAHALDITHRDLKPANVLLPRNGAVKLVDFGSAKIGGGSMQATAGPGTMTGMVIGTPAYMSPEQAEGDPVDARSDIFSLGAMLYEMISGVRVFERTNMLTTLSAVVREQPQPLAELVPSTPAKLAALTHKCLRKDPRLRFANATALRQALKQAMATC